MVCLREGSCVAPSARATSPAVREEHIACQMPMCVVGSTSFLWRVHNSPTVETCVPISASLAAEIDHAVTDADRHLSDETGVESGAQPPRRRGNEGAAANYPSGCLGRGEALCHRPRSTTDHNKEFANGPNNAAGSRRGHRQQSRARYPAVRLRAQGRDQLGRLLRIEKGSWHSSTRRRLPTQPRADFTNSFGARTGDAREIVAGRMLLVMSRGSAMRAGATIGREPLRCEGH
jgi:hypothetical protein